MLVPRGYTTAIYAGRANLQPLVYESGWGIEPVTVPRGLLMITSEVENYPGFPDGIEGPALMALLKRQAERFGAKIRTKDVTRVDLSPFSRYCR